jgi:hypothetical protein
MKQFSSRYKPVGWRGESYRHYLASKGIKTSRRLSNFYFAVRHELKGHRGYPGLSGEENAAIKRGFSKGHSLEDMQNPSIASSLGLSVAAVRSALVSKQSAASRVPEGVGGDSVSRSRFYSDFVDSGSAEFVPLPEPDLPVVQSSIPEVVPDVSVSDVVSDSGLSRSDVSGELVMTPGVPERSSLSFGSGVDA